MINSVSKEVFLRPQQLTLADIEALDLLKLGHVSGDVLVLERSMKGYTLKKSVPVPIEKILAVANKNLVKYIFSSFICERPCLIPYVLENRSLLELARYYLRYQTGSHKTLYGNVECISHYSKRVGLSPDSLISEAKDETDVGRPERIAEHVKALEEYVGELQDQGLTPSTVANYIKALRSLFRANGLEIKLPHALPRRVVYKDRAPKPEELQRLLAVAELRGKVIISVLALGGFREGTLVQLRYRHVREDLEKGIVPVHVHVESEITKGRYHEYDSFLGEEAVTYLRLYLQARREGSIHRMIPPEEITDESPLIRDEMYEVARPISEKQVRKIVHDLYFKAMLLKKKKEGGRYSLCVHSLRKYFKTQLMALGAQSDYVEYMMGHTVSVYHDIESKGTDFLRKIYATAGLSIQPKTTVARIDMVKEFARGLGMDPESILIKHSFSEPDTKYVNPQQRETEEIRSLISAIKTELTTHKR